MDPGDFIALAREIVDHLDQISPNYSEAAYRTSISMIYYGLLHWMQNRFTISVPGSKLKAFPRIKEKIKEGFKNLSLDLSLWKITLARSLKAWRAWSKRLPLLNYYHCSNT